MGAMATAAGLGERGGGVAGTLSLSSAHWRRQAGAAPPSLASCKEARAERTISDAEGDLTDVNLEVSNTKVTTPGSSSRKGSTCKCEMDNGGRQAEGNTRFGESPTESVDFCSV